MGELIVITGDLAALKTTLCRRLQEAYQLKAIIKDDLKEMLYDNHPERDNDFIHTLSDVTFHEMVSIAKASPTPVLFEGNFKPHEIAVIHQEFTRVLWFFVTASAKVRYARYLKREPSRHPAHKRYGTLSYEAFLRAHRTAESYMCVVDTTDETVSLSLFKSSIDSFLKETSYDNTH